MKKVKLIKKQNDRRSKTMNPYLNTHHRKSFLLLSKIMYKTEKLGIIRCISESKDKIFQFFPGLLFFH